MQPTRPSPWQILKMKTRDVPSAWRRRAGEQFDAFRAAALKIQPQPAKTFRCEKCNLGCTVTIYSPDRIIAKCEQCTHNCPPVSRSTADIEILELDFHKLGGNLCNPLSIDPKDAGYELENTRQIGSWSTDVVPVILSIKQSPYQFEHDLTSVIAQPTR